jgi:hypothetical protein
VPEAEPSVVVTGDVKLVSGADGPEELSATVVLADVLWLADEVCATAVLAPAFVLVLVEVVVQRRLRAALPVDACLAARLRATHVRDEPAAGLAALRFGVVVAVDGVLVVGALVVVVGVLLVVVVGALVVVVGVLVVVVVVLVALVVVGVVDAVAGVVTCAGVVVVTVVEGVVAVVVVDTLGVVSAVELVAVVVVASVVGVVSVVVPDAMTAPSATASPRPLADAGPIVATAGATAATATAVATRTRRARRRWRPELERLRAITSRRLARPDKSCDAIG